MANMYSTFNEALHREILDPLEAANNPEDRMTVWQIWDIDEIAYQVIDTDGTNYRCAVDPKEFWDIVEDNEI